MSCDSLLETKASLKIAREIEFLWMNTSVQTPPTPQTPQTPPTPMVLIMWMFPDNVTPLKSPTPMDFNGLK